MSGTWGGLLADEGSCAKFLVPRGVHQQMKVHLPNFWYPGGHLADEGSSAKFLAPRGVHWQKKVHLPNLSSQTFRCGHQRGLFTSHKTKKQNSLKMQQNYLCPRQISNQDVMKMTHVLTFQGNTSQVSSSFTLQNKINIPINAHMLLVSKIAPLVSP